VKSPLADEIDAAVAELKRLGSKRTRDEMARRYGIRLPDPSRAFGVAMADIQQLARRMGRNHELAVALWESGWYDARMLAAFVDEPERVTSPQMDRWCRDFDNWALCDTVCFKLFDRVPPALALRKVRLWSARRDEFERRAAFALLASLSLHDKETDDRLFAACLPLIERAAGDERNLVKKGVSWALRSVGRRSRELNAAAVALARRLASSAKAAARWVGKDALRELMSPAVTGLFATRGRPAD
jgi:3-methyladenine DNA glycosylase AlkD